MHSTLAATKLLLNTPQCTESRLHVTTVYWGELKSVRSKILGVKLRLNFFHLWLLIAATGNKPLLSDGMSLQTYAANYWPGMPTTALSLVHLNWDIYWKRKGKTFPFLVWLLLSKCGLSLRSFKIFFSVLVFLTGMQSSTESFGRFLISHRNLKTEVGTVGKQ